LAIALLFVGLLAPSVGSAEPPLPSKKEVTSKLDDLYRSTSSHARITMKVTTKHYTRSLDIESWSIGDELALMVIRAPARESGTSTLRTAEGLWNYAPRADRLVRIPTAMLSESWMGSHFTNDDLMRESAYDQDFDTTLAWATDGGERRLKVTMVPKADAAIVWSKIEFFLTADEWLPVRADYYDRAQVVRRSHFRNLKMLGGRKIPAEMEIIPVDKPGESTKVTYQSLSFDQKVDRALFSPRGLRKVARQR